jgi:hypothetical protein
MTNTPLLATAATAALILLAGCQSEPIKVGEGADPQAEALKNAPKVALPPTMKDKTYRCKDNSVVYVSFSSDNLTAMVRDKEEEPPRTTLKAPAPGQPFEGQGPEAKGFKLSGSGDTVTYTSPDSGTQTCRA